MNRRRCLKCKELRPIKQYSMYIPGSPKRKKVCRYCNYDGLFYEEKDEILREAYRHYAELEAYFSGVSDSSNPGVGWPGKAELTYSVPSIHDFTKYYPVTISFYDLKTTLETVKLAKRKREAFELGVLQDKLHREVGAIMGITTVSVGQYISAACKQLAEVYFSEEKPISGEKG